MTWFVVYDPVSGAIDNVSFYRGRDVAAPAALPRPPGFGLLVREDIGGAGRKTHRVDVADPALPLISINEETS
ncbi:MAG: hypothetical protein WD407_04470 [Rhodospirillales bacterium]